MNFAVKPVRGVRTASQPAPGAAMVPGTTEDTWMVALQSGRPADIAAIEVPKGRHVLHTTIECFASSLLQVVVRVKILGVDSEIDRVSSGVPLEGRFLKRDLKPIRLNLARAMRVVLSVDAEFKGLGKCGLRVHGALHAEQLT